MNPGKTLPKVINFETYLAEKAHFAHDLTENGLNIADFDSVKIYLLQAFHRLNEVAIISPEIHGNCIKKIFSEKEVKNLFCKSALYLEVRLFKGVKYQVPVIANILFNNKAFKQ